MQPSCMIDPFSCFWSLACLSTSILSKGEPSMRELRLDYTIDCPTYLEYFVHASLGFPAPTTFMNAARKGFINGTNQYTKLTSKLVAKHMPNAMATARGHLERKPASRPHSASQSVSALRRLRADQHVITKSSKPFDPTTVTRSQTLHM
jgi:hypothetical protein